MLYFITPMLAPLPAESIWASRNLITLPFLAAVLLSMRQWYLVREIWARIRRTPLLLVGVLASGALVAVQLWLFAWAPLNGRGLQVALGYFLLPLVLVVIGRFLYRDTLKWWHWCAAGVAAIGVIAQIFALGGISWETLVVCLGYPMYFVLRRSLKIGHIGGMLWEFAVLSPLAVALVVIELAQGTALTENPDLLWSTPVFAVVAAFALWLYVLASKLLPISLFGLLSYLEPALLVVASLLIGERIAPSEVFSYAMIWTAVLILLLGGLGDMLGKRRRKPIP